MVKQEFHDYADLTEGTLQDSSAGYMLTRMPPPDRVIPKRKLTPFFNGPIGTAQSLNALGYV